MAVFALSDLHLSFQVEKPMDVFGNKWHGYVNSIEENWKNIVSENDTVLIPGDVSWGTYLDQAKKDFEFIYNLPGIKYISKGNHDYWWETVTKMTAFLEENGLSDKIKFVYKNENNSSRKFYANGKALCGEFDSLMDIERVFIPTADITDGMVIEVID